MKEYMIKSRRYGYHGIKEREYTGTLQELTDKFSYILICGKSWEHERGKKKINLQPKTIRSLITNLNNAENNAARNGFSNTQYVLVEGGDKK